MGAKPRTKACGRRWKAECRGNCAWVYSRCRMNKPPCATAVTNSNLSDNQRRAACEAQRGCTWKRWRNVAQYPLRCYASPPPPPLPRCPYMDPVIERSYWKVVRRIQAPLDGNVFVAPSPGRGLGVFAARAFRSGERITTYSGVLVPDAVAKGWPHLRTSHIRTLMHDCLVVDGFRAYPPPLQAGLASFINDGRGPQAGQNNAKLVNIFDAGNDRLIPICIAVAIKAIPQGSEVLVSYGSSYWTRRE